MPAGFPPAVQALGPLAVVAIVLVRPAAMTLSLLRTPLSGRERATAAWFEPKGFASVVCGLLEFS